MKKEAALWIEIDSGRSRMIPGWRISTLPHGKPRIPKSAGRHSASYTDKTALAFMGVHITFAELDRYANRFAHMLLSLGTEKGLGGGDQSPQYPGICDRMAGRPAGGMRRLRGIPAPFTPRKWSISSRIPRPRVLVTLDALYAAKLAPGRLQPPGSQGGGRSQRRWFPPRCKEVSRARC